MVDSDLIKIHPSARVSPLADLEPSTRNTKIVIGAECSIDSFVKIKPVGGNSDVILGKRCYINSGCVLYSGNGIKVGNNVLIASNCTLAPVNHSYRDRSCCCLRGVFFVGVCERGSDDQQQWLPVMWYRSTRPTLLVIDWDFLPSRTWTVCVSGTLV